eukprot:30936-Pelagococcus_subviridis.AAC.8
MLTRSRFKRRGGLHGSHLRARRAASMARLNFPRESIRACRVRRGESVAFKHLTKDTRSREKGEGTRHSDRRLAEFF